MEKMAITTERLHIRNLRPADLDDFHRYRSNPKVTRYQGFGVMTREEAAQFIEGQKDKLFGEPDAWVQYGLELRSGGHLIGDCAVKLRSDNQAEIGITISHLEQKKGYAKEVLLALLHFLFDQHGVHRVVETVDADNLASINLLRSAGFRQEGHFIENIFFKGQWGSELQFALLKREWDDRS
jgi:RimJ/RimL family protein N-acetyltransferase